jgi:hypothetical protein
VQKNVNIAEDLMKKEPTNASIYVVLGNTYAAAGMKS